MKFTVHKTDGRARTGLLETKHGSIETPVFMPVGTAATVKAVTVDDLEALGAQIILGNTYHLMLRPGAEEVAALGGLHEFMQWKGPILTDSGGFQVMSLSKIRKITEDGVKFQSHLDGREYMLTPERSIEIQRLLGATITMIFDECTPYPATEKQASDSMELSLRWAARSKQAYQQRNGYGLFGIVQGSVYENLRKRSAEELGKMDFDGMAIGGLAVGEGQELMFNTLDFTVPVLPVNKPRYLMGVGKPLDIVGAVLRGVDMFDCVLPTRSGRHGQIFTRNGAININNAKYAADKSVIDESSPIAACNRYSKGYLHHLMKANEILGSMLCTQVNLYFYLNMMKEVRAAIEAGTLQDYYDKMVRNYSKPEAAS